MEAEYLSNPSDIIDEEEYEDSEEEKEIEKQRKGREGMPSRTEGVSGGSAKKTKVIQGRVLQQVTA